MVLDCPQAELHLAEPLGAVGILHPLLKQRHEQAEDAARTPPRPRCGICRRQGAVALSRVHLGHLIRLCLRPECRRAADDRVRVMTWRLYYCGPRPIKLMSVAGSSKPRQSNL